MTRTIVAITICAALTACSNGSTEEITGVVSEVDASTLTDVDSFTVRADDRTYEFIVTEETELAFPPAHLNEHRVSGEPVAVTYERRDHGLYALTVDDG